MQILQPEFSPLETPGHIQERLKHIDTIHNNDEYLIESFLLGTKPTNHETPNPDDDFIIDKQYGHTIAHTFNNKHFAIIPELIHTRGPLGGGHFWSNNKDEILAGYAKHSHGIITKIKGPYSYNDGTDDYYYKSNIKLAGSKAASVLIEEGQKTWIPYATSIHLWTGDDKLIKDAEGLGIALVIKGAFGDQGVVTKLCKGNGQSCEKSLGASITYNSFANTGGTTTTSTGIMFNDGLCDKEDQQVAEKISSLVSKAASIQTYMVDNAKADNATSPPTEAQKPTQNITTDPQNHLTQSPSSVQEQNQNQNNNAIVTITAEELQTLRSKAESVTDMENERKSELLSSMFGGIEDEKERSAVIKEYSKEELKTIRSLKSFYDKVEPILKLKFKKEIDAQANPTEDPKVKGKSKGASINTGLRPEPKPVDNEETSIAASVKQPVNECLQLRRALEVV